MPQILIKPNGQITYLNTPENSTIGIEGDKTVRRASNIEPVNPTLRKLFYAVRRFGPVGEAISRRMARVWRVNLSLSGGPTYGRFRNRQHAIESEERWLLANGMGQPCDA